MNDNLAALVCSLSGYPGAMPQCDECQYQSSHFDGEENHLICGKEE
jgi:hypothetical protein